MTRLRDDHDVYKGSVYSCKSDRKSVYSQIYYRVIFPSERKNLSFLMVQIIQIA